ncbi:MAG: (2Fe-2S)-binding protein, partial [Myxococcota bacterium]
RIDAPEGARLLDVLRAQGKCTGVKDGCGEGECGACTVLIDGEAACSCMMFFGQVAGQRVDTIEALAAGTPDPLIVALVEAGGVQCGFCTPGIVVAARALLKANPKPTRHDIQVGLSGNICRCTGYHRIIDAIENVISKPRQASKASRGRAP